MSERITLDTEVLTSLYLHDGSEAQKSIVRLQIEHRIELVKLWRIRPGDTILEVGCGQGDCTVALAAAVGEEGHVTALDPAPKDYGSPFTVVESQAHIHAGPLGPRVHFVNADIVQFLQSTPTNFTIAVLAHCIWYFASPETLESIFTQLARRVQRICLAEWSLTASDIRGMPHVFASLTQASLECRKKHTTSNIRTVLSPAAIHDIAQKAGLEPKQQKTFAPVEGLMDAWWEVSTVLGREFTKEVEEHVQDAKERAVVFALRDATRSSRTSLKDKGLLLRAMDVWAAVYTTRKTA
ncbi:unnamed protein product [Somion occarium]|uniref:Methyltransferase domain-containing protein n=1 Tax=Somion occarium TaxID=3059160 RepID=A0ABP1DTS0_9APHY